MSSDAEKWTMPEWFQDVCRAAGIEDADEYRLKQLYQELEKLQEHLATTRQEEELDRLKAEIEHAHDIMLMTLCEAGAALKAENERLKDG